MLRNSALTRLSLLVCLLVTLGYQRAVAQHASKGRQTSIGVLLWDRGTMYFREMDSPTIIQSVSPLKDLSDFLKPGRTYKADIWEWQEFGHTSLEMMIRYGDTYIGMKDLIPWTPAYAPLGCKGPIAEAEAVKDGLRHCNADDLSRDMPAWREGDSLLTLSAREQFEFYCLIYQLEGEVTAAHDPYVLGDDYLRGFNEFEVQQRENRIAKIGELLPQLNPPPEIPEDARKAFIEGATFLKNGDPFHSADSFETAEDAAPWWADAFYNRAQALRTDQRYDDATEELKLYSLLNTGESARREALDSTYAIGAEKEVAEKKKQEALAKEAAQYVSGGAERVKVADTPSAWVKGASCWVQCLYTYAGFFVYYPNVFRMPGGHYIAIDLYSTANGTGEFTGDEILLADLTAGGADGGTNIQRYPFGTVNGDFDLGGGARYKVSVSERSSSGVVSVSDSQSGATVTMPLADLYSARYSDAVAHMQVSILGSKSFSLHDQGESTPSAVLFSTDLGHADPLSLVPSYVIPLDYKNHSIGSSGYSLRWVGNKWEIAKD